MEKDVFIVRAKKHFEWYADTLAMQIIIFSMQQNAISRYLTSQAERGMKF